MALCGFCEVEAPSVSRVERKGTLDIFGELESQKMVCSSCERARWNHLRHCRKIHPGAQQSLP